MSRLTKSSEKDLKFRQVSKYRRIGGFVSCITNPIVRKFQKLPQLSLNLTIQSEFSPTLSASIKISDKNRTLVEGDSIKKPLLLILVSKS